MNTYLSEKIKKLSGLSMLLIVMLHGQLIEYSTGLNKFFQLYCTQGVTRIAVPLFFLISGYLYFHNIDDFTWLIYKKKTISRTKSLFVPFIVWSLFGFLFVYSFQSLVPSSFNSAGSIRDYDIQQVLYTLFWKPIGNFQLWFIRDLFCVFLVSPIVYFANKYIGKLYLLILFLLWLLGKQYIISIEAVFFVSLGAWLSIHKEDIMEKRYNCKMTSATLGLLWALLCFFVQYFQTGYTTRCLCIMTGLLFLWLFYDNFTSLLKWTSLLKYPFFVYCFHEPLMTTIKGIVLKFNTSQLVLFLAYLIIPIMTVCLSMSVAYVLSRRLPGIYKTITGGR